MQTPTRPRMVRGPTAAGHRHEPWLLLVDDNPADVDLMCEALRDGDAMPEVRVARSGGEALQLLRHAADGELEPPAFVLLDLNLPGIDGHSVLCAMRSDAQLCHVPVVVFSSSSAPQDVLEAYRAGANCYLTKPMSLVQYRQTVRSLERFWLDVATLPVLP